MTQTAEKPIALSYDKLHEKFEQNFPTLLAPLEQIKEKLDRGEGAQDLANIISCEVKETEEPTAFVYTWTGQKGQVFECRVLKPFEPKPERKTEVSQDAPEAPEESSSLQESTGDAQVAEEGAHAPVEAEETSHATPKVEAETGEPTPEPTIPNSSPGLFSALAKLIGDTTLLMTLAKHDDDLTVNVMPFGEDKDSSIAAICLTGTPAELDEGFAQAIAVKVQGRQSLAEQIEAIKAAEKKLADAKKAEADTKKAEAAKKTKVAEAKKKEEEKKKQDEEKEAERAKSQEALF